MAETDRIRTLDFVRGIAVMGILAMNIINFAMPEAAYTNPVAWGHKGEADLWAWAAAFVLVDGKMRGLFSMLFGASMLLMFERGVAAGEDAGAAHRRRMAWLLVFGLVHYFLIWDGDILTMYALCGLAGMGMLLLETRALMRVSAMLIICAMMLYVLLALTVMTDVRDGMQADIAEQLSVFRSNYWNIVVHRIRSDWSGPLVLVLIYGLETLGLMALGMALLRNGFLRGDWTALQYARLAGIAYAIGLPPLAGLALWCWARDFDPYTVSVAAITWATPFRLAVMLGHAALAIWAIKRWPGLALTQRIGAVGRAAFSNYLGTSIVMTTLFYGYGFGLFGQPSRWQAYLVCLPVWIAMLIWSKPWLEHYRYGPMEWAWRGLARGRIEKMQA